MVTRAAAHVFVTDIDRPACDADDAHHLARVLRLRPGEALTASDGAGRWRDCEWTTGDAIAPAGEVVTEPRPTPAVTIGFSVLKGDRTEWVVQKLTELGVDRILPLLTERTVVRWDAARRQHQVGRLRRVAREAAMQSRRVWLPEVLEVTSFDAAGAVVGGDGPALAHFGGDPPSLERPAVLVGPEGGWSDAELAAGRPTVTLGPGVLRAETAAITAGALLTALRHGVVLPRDEPPPAGA